MNNPFKSPQSGARMAMTSADPFDPRGKELGDTALKMTTEGRPDKISGSNQVEAILEAVFLNIAAAATPAAFIGMDKATFERLAGQFWQANRDAMTEMGQEPVSGIEFRPTGIIRDNQE